MRNFIRGLRLRAEPERDGNVTGPGRSWAGVRNQLENLVDRGGVRGVGGGIGRLAEIDVERGQHRLHAGVAVGGAENFGEAALDDFEGDVRGDGGAGRGAEEGGEGAVGIGDDFGAERETAGVGFFQRLHADTGVDEAPVGGTGLGVKRVEGAQAGGGALQSLRHEEADEHAVAQAGAEKRGEVVGADRARQVGDAAGAVEKLGRPRGEGAEEEHALAVEVANIEVWAAEGAGIGRRRAVYFAGVTRDDGGICANQPLAGDGERREAAGDGEVGRAEQRNRAAAGADEDEACAYLTRRSGGEIAHGEFPAGVGVAQVGDAVAGYDPAAGLGAEPREKAAGEFTEINVGAGVDFGGGDGFGGAAVDEERGPLVEDGGVGGEGHFPKKRMRGESGVAGAEEGDGVGAADEAQVRHGADPLGGAGSETLGDGVAPELARELEAGENLDGLRDVDRIAGRGGRGRVVEFAEAGVAGAGVVPTVGAFAGGFGGRLVDLNREPRIELLEHHSEVGGHDAAADENDVGGGAAHRGLDGYLRNG